MSAQIETDFYIKEADVQVWISGNVSIKAVEWSREEDGVYPYNLELEGKLTVFYDEDGDITEVFDLEKDELPYWLEEAIASTQEKLLLMEMIRS